MRSRRARLGGFLAGMVLGGLAGSCSSSTSPVTSLPSSDPVATNAMQFCSDTVTYLEQHLSEIAPSNCATGEGLPNVGECEGEYNACIAASSGVDASTVNSELGLLLAGCNSKLSGCQGVNVGQVAQCIADIVGAQIAASSTITATTACANGKAPVPPADPASCVGLPSDCRIGL
jgi:hypothetical protein